jgi:tRNA(Ile)-lysidine synthetase-like protein
MSRTISPIGKALRAGIPQGARCLVATSGGIDSVVLLDALAHIRTDHDLHIEVAHVDHGLRPESTGDARFVRDLAAQYNLSFHLCTGAQPLPGENIEAWGRELRYSFFQEIRISRGLDWTITAHHAQDAVETLLVRLIQNRDYTGIQKVDEQRRLLRPLVGIFKGDIEAYAAQESLEWREDATNRDESFLRNKVRHSLLPTMQELFGEKIIETLSNRASILVDDSQALTDLAAPLVKLLTPIEQGSKSWRKQCVLLLERVPQAVQRRVVQEVMLPHCGYKVGASAADRVLDVLFARVKGCELEGGLSISRSEGGVILQHQKSSNA